MNSETEVWKSIPGFDIYEASNLGRIRSHGKRIIRSLLIDGYPRVDCYISKYSKKSIYVHRLVALAFIPNPENKPQVNHKDSNRKNNNVSNLEWVTHQENMIHARKSAVRKFKSRAKIDSDMVNSIRSSNLSTRKLSVMHGVSRGTVYNIKNRITWTHI